jgi:hypothetical protein
MLKSVLTNPKNGKALHIDESDGRQLLVVTNENFIHGTFRSVSHITAGTTIITEPLGDGAIALTDLIVSTDKVNLSVISVRFTDDVEIINIYQGFATDAPINFAISFNGRWDGWKNARIEMETTLALKATVAVGYYRLEQGDQFSVWDARR